MEKIEDYSLDRIKENELGRGSYSIVYLGSYDGPSTNKLKNGVRVAIKIIKISQMTQKGKEILHDEISVMELIKINPHPNIVECYDVIRKPHEVYIVMEYCTSGDLNGILKKPIMEKYAQFYFCQLANGLKYLDKHKIIHRDIKPKNILLTSQRKVLKIADFGFAKKIKEHSLLETMCGSPLYMAPEIMSNNMYNNQTDLWSIGLILYEMLYGNHPFGNCKSIPELQSIIQTINIEIPPSNTKNKTVSDECTSLIKKLLKKTPGERIQWDEFFDHLWVRKYQYEIPKQVQPNEEYEKQLYSTSVGSLSKEEGIKAISGSPIIRMSCIDNFNIVENYCDQLETSETTINKDKHKKTDSFVTEECIFEMDFDDGSKQKKKIKRVIEKSSVLDNNNNEYDIVETIE